MLSRSSPELEEHACKNDFLVVTAGEVLCVCGAKEVGVKAEVSDTHAAVRMRRLAFIIFIIL